VAAASFAAREAGPDTVHVTAAAISAALIANRQCLLWTVLAAKETTAPDHRWPADGEPVYRTYSASYLFDGVSIRRLDSNARTMHARGGSSNESPWNLTDDIPL
jgi:hypothetical protein